MGPHSTHLTSPHLTSPQNCTSQLERAEAEEEEGRPGPAVARYACWALSVLLDLFAGLRNQWLWDTASGPVLDFAIAFVHTVRAACTCFGRVEGLARAYAAIPCPA
jgi:hypothetical protein